jgi:hypothetical protein
MSLRPEVSGYPPGIADRHIDVARRPWVRWAGVAVVAALPVLALLNFFGQSPSTTRASSPVADVSLTAPTRLRSGLTFQTRVAVRAHTSIGHLALAFSSGWWDSMSVSSIEPQPSTQAERTGQVMLDMGSLAAGQTLTVWINFSVNPTNAGNRSEDLAVMDGSHTLVRLHRSLTIFP